MSETKFLSRWSRLKSAQSQQAPGVKPAEAKSADPGVQPQEASILATDEHPRTHSELPLATATTTGMGTASSPPLPAVEQLTPADDFTPFMARSVDMLQRSKALKKLFTDPHFNQMDGLDVYIDDYSIPDPISPEELKLMAHARSILNLDAADTNVEEKPGAEANVESIAESIAKPQPAPLTQPQPAPQSLGPTALENHVPQQNPEAKQTGEPLKSKPESGV